MREIADTAQEAGYHDFVTRLLPLLAKFMTDVEPAIRSQLAQQLHPLACFTVEVCSTREVP